MLRIIFVLLLQNSLHIASAFFKDWKYLQSERLKCSRTLKQSSRI